MKLLLIFIFVNIATCKLRKKSSSRIVGGQDVNISVHPWQLSLTSFGYSHICGASILNENWAITAAHCIDKKLPYSYKLRAGSSFWNKDGTTHQIVNIVQIEDPEIDVAVLEVWQPFDFRNTIARPVSLPKINENPLVNSKVIVTGWGLTDQQGQTSYHLQEVSINVLSNYKCQYMYFGKAVIHPYEICAGVSTGGKDACQGDSGGPLVDSNGLLIGIVAWGIECGSAEHPGVYTRVAHPTVRKFIYTYTGS